MFWIMPEIAERFGWIRGPGWLLAGFALLWAVNRWIYPVCPTCAHSHDHDACSTRLHGFAAPLITAAALHSLLDGLGIAVSQNPISGDLGRAVFWGIVLHKVPEGLALGVILRASLKTWKGAMAGCLLTQIPMLAGGMLETLADPFLNVKWVVILLAMAGGSFLFLGTHTIHIEWKRKSAMPAFTAAIAGAAVAAILQQALRALGHVH